MKSSPVLSGTPEQDFKADDVLETWPFVHRILGTIDAVASSRATVLITGESGTGKELVARAIHLRGMRRSGPFKAINCAALPEQLFESELFGYEAGAFTGAIRQKPGLFEQANGGTLLLDEITEMSPSLQAKMLRVLQEREVQRLGSLVAMPIDVRVIATSNRHLPEEIDAGHFRKDLFYRLNVVPIHVPPLRERRQDIPLLVARFLSDCNRDNGRRVNGVSPAAMRLLEKYSWPGNVRELENFMTRAVVVADGPVLGPDDFPGELIDGAGRPGDHPVTVGRTIQEVVRELIVATLEAEGHNQTKAADRLGISTRTLRNKLYEYGIKIPGENSMSQMVERVRVLMANDGKAA
jgi:transcriptional regulator with PAS, ATPase and Fis domain